jgi:hypothetical protein
MNKRIEKDKDSHFSDNLLKKFKREFSSDEAYQALYKRFLEVKEEVNRLKGKEVSLIMKLNEVTDNSFIDKEKELDELDESYKGLNWYKKKLLIKGVKVKKLLSKISELEGIEEKWKVVCTANEKSIFKIVELKSKVNRLEKQIKQK